VWFNSMQRAEPYLGLTCPWYRPERGGTRKGAGTAAAWLSSARAVRCWVKSRNERNPRRQLAFAGGTAGLSRRKVGTTSSQHGAYVQGDTHATMAGTKGMRGREAEPIPAKPAPVRIAGCNSPA
jgi:hypothetical protein